jgi:small-conductance mechanosensitive channel
VMKAAQILAFKLARASLWPLYLLLLAYAARVAPWPRSLGILVSAVLTAAAIAVLIHDLLRLLAWPADASKRLLNLPAPVARQLERAGRFLVVTAVLFLLPAYVFNHELISPEGRPFTGPALGRLLVIVYELLVWGSFVRLLSRKSPALLWLATPLASGPEQQTTASRLPEPSSSHAALRIHRGLAWLGRHRRLATFTVLAASASIIVLDIRGYSFTARRLASGSWQTLLAMTLAVAGYRGIARAISRNAWRWARPSHSWALALTSAMAFRASARSRAAIGGLIAAPEATAGSAGAVDDSVPLEDLAAGLRRLSSYAMIALSLLATAWIWDLDLALVRFLLAQPLWPGNGQVAAVTFGNVAVAAIFVLLGALAWRYMSTLFAVTIFLRMPDDPGVRFAVVTLCRYAVLGLTTLAALSAVHLDLAKIGVVLAALGVGLGFGLQEIVSNFVCGIILLLERPIRIGDVVTVAGTTGKVDRINIRATTIVNGDNQSMIVPNREFITGNLVNWTLKDKILRVAIKLSVAYGTDPDKVVNLLLSIAREDPDVLLNPAPSALLEGFGDSALLFGLYTFVPDPGIAGGVRHRLCTEVQRRFVADGIVIPFPTQELHLNRVPVDLTRALLNSRDDDALFIQQPYRSDPATRTPPAPHSLTASEQKETAQNRIDL